MINKYSVLGIIPARGGSKGIKNKNLIKLNNYPLIYWPIKTLKKSKYIDNFILSTDSKRISKVANQFNCKTPFLRPKSISNDNSSSISLVIHALDYFKSKNMNYYYVVLLEPTSPLTTENDIDRAIKVLEHNQTYADSIVGVSKNINLHPEFNYKIDKKGLIKFKKKTYSKRRQNLTTNFFLDGSLYISKVSSIYKHKTFYHNKTLGFITPKWKSFELDDKIDLLILNAIMKNKKNYEKKFRSKIFR